MVDLFDTSFEEKLKSFAPLADRIRPKILAEFVGQKELLGPGKPLRAMLEAGSVASMILWGPPGSGKTTLARLIAKYTRSHFEQFSAVTAGIEDVRRVISQAGERLKYEGRRTILFVDEIHRFNKSQQDAFLPYVENGSLILVGATAENPSFEVNAPLISRAQVYVLKPLSDPEVTQIARRALKQLPKLEVESKALAHMVKSANGDARAAINALELANFLAKDNRVSLEIAEQAVQKKALFYDKAGDQHYDTISAFIKSLRASEPDAALHWLARMVKAGEDPVFVARRMLIFASEDIGNADPQALVVATAAAQAVHMIGMPEAQLILAQAATYLATAPKSTASYQGLIEALADVEKQRVEPVPLHLRNAPTELLRQLGWGKGHIRYPWQEPKPVKQEYLPQNLRGRRYYRPQEYSEEAPRRGDEDTPNKY